MSVPILLSYFDHCKNKNITPNIKELNAWNLMILQRDKRFILAA